MNPQEQSQTDLAAALYLAKGGAEHFVNIINLAYSLWPGVELQILLEVSGTTLLRWRSGLTAPHPLAVPGVYQRLLTKLLNSSPHD